MSWFAEDLATSLAADSSCRISDTATDVEVAEGVVVERRSVLWLSAATVASMLAGSTRGVAQDPAKRDGRGREPRRDGLSHEQFLAQVYPLAQQVVASKGKDEAAYLMSVAAAMSRLSDPRGDLRAAMRKFVRAHREEGKRFPLAAVSMRLQAGRGFPHHDHRDYNGVIMGVAGEVRIRNFDILGGKAVPPEGTTFQIRETRDDLILPGRFSTLGRGFDNVHELVAGPDGARVLDVFTYFASGARSYYLDVEKKPRDAERRIWDAAWRPRRRRRRR